MTPAAAALAVLIILVAFGLMTAAFLLLRGAGRVETLGIAAGVGCFLTGFAIQGLLPGLRAKAPDARPVYPDETALYGEEIYIREGCAVCHSQCRLPDEAGWPLRLEDRAWDRSGLGGVRRLGPDLARLGHEDEGGRQTSPARLAHQLAEPRSIMPSYARLFTRVPTAGGGARWKPGREAAALIDYLQRLGRPGWTGPSASATPAPSVLPTPAGPPPIPEPSPTAPEPAGSLTEEEQWFLVARREAELFAKTPAGIQLRNRSRTDDEVRRFTDALVENAIDLKVPPQHRAMFKEIFFRTLRSQPTPTPEPERPSPSIPSGLPASPLPTEGGD